MQDEDKIAGMLYGAALGDALGAPHELRGKYPLNMYNGKLYLDVRLQSRFGLKTGPIGSTTDDTAMTMALARSLIDNNAFDEEQVVLAYEDFANGTGNRIGPNSLVREKVLGLGKNTRALFGNIKTYGGYKETG